MNYIAKNIIRETEKAILVNTDVAYDKKADVWLPKSQIQFEKGTVKRGNSIKKVEVIAIPEWLTKAKNICWLEMSSFAAA